MSAVENQVPGRGKYVVLHQLRSLLHPFKERPLPRPGLVMCTCYLPADFLSHSSRFCKSFDFTFRLLITFKCVRPL
jgi:hypothetical protein